ncbi:hypothetical protein AOLI_G00304150 [Acnodon oligacanthus]
MLQRRGLSEYGWGKEPTVLRTVLLLESTCSPCLKGATALSTAVQAHSPSERKAWTRTIRELGSRTAAGAVEGDLWLGQGLQHRTWELPLTPARVLCCSQWNCCAVHIRRTKNTTKLQHFSLVGHNVQPSFITESLYRNVRAPE